MELEVVQLKNFNSKLAPHIDQFLSYRKALYYSNTSYEQILSNLDRFCVENYPNITILSQDIVLHWMQKRPCEKSGGLSTRACTIRKFGTYLDGMGLEAYILPLKFVGGSSSFTPYIFTDDELARLFLQIDKIKATKKYPFSNIVLPVLFRLIYTCGLRPNEGRELKTANITLKTGEILITNTKRHKDRIIVMSADMKQLCARYDEKRKIFAKDSEYFFMRTNGNVLPNEYILNQFKRCWKQANIDSITSDIPNVRLYDLRHRFATATLHRWLDMGIDLNAKLPYLRTYMGHSNLTQTAYYIHLLPENLLSSNYIEWEGFNTLIPEVDIWTN